MSLWSAFYPSLLPHVTGCSEPMMDMALCDAAQKFFRDSRAWQQWLTAVTVATGDREYPLPLPSGSEVLQLDAATVNGTPFDILSWRSFCADPDDVQGENSGLTTLDRIVFTLSRELPAGTLVKIRATLVPSDDATGIPDDLFVQYGKSIAKGARAQLQATKDKPYTDVAMAGIAQGEFLAAIGTANIQTYRGNTSSTPRLRPTWC